MKQETDHTYQLKLWVRNRPGALVRCAQVFGRRGHNIEALQVSAEPGNHDESIMHITAFGDQAMIRQIVAQLAKLVDVSRVEEEQA